MVAAHSKHHHPPMEAMAQPTEPLPRKHHQGTHLPMGPHPHLTEPPEKQNRLQAGLSDLTLGPRPPRPMAAPGAKTPPQSRRL